MRLLEALKAPDAPAVLRAMEHWTCRLVRRSIWVLRRARRGLHEIVLIERLGLHTALPQYSFALYQPDLSALLRRVIGRVLQRMPEEVPPPGTLTMLGRLFALAGGRRVWSGHLAPP
ncbi:hypothetical protein GCM10009416_00490 [Craurococcus roseus]|uniref:Uncharacterized protein n=1 Tax=Craurococcus roseus TaxID=77585 RepID=A0ABP3PG66_9PROT